jgi:hypothetical protein
VTALTPVERVVSLLKNVHYRPLQTPLEIATLRFDAGAALVGTGHMADLVLVFDSATTPADRIQRSVEGIARALDVVGSRRPLTVIIVGLVPSASVLADLSKSCRVLPLGSATNEPTDQAMKDWLAALLPLDIPTTVANLESPLALLESAGEATEFSAQILNAARGGSAAVSREFIRRLESALAPVERNDER